MKTLKPKTNPFDEAIKDEAPKEKKENSIERKAKAEKKTEKVSPAPTEDAPKPAKRGRGRPSIDPSDPNHRTRFILWVPQGIMDEVRKCASDRHETISKYIVDCLIEKNGKAVKGEALAKLDSLKKEEIAKAKDAKEVESIIKKYGRLAKKA